MKRNQSSTLIVVCLVLVFTLPLVAADYLFKRSHSLHLVTSNHGTLILPVVLPEQLPFKPLLNQWSLLYYTTACCDKECLINLLVAHQIIKSFGADAPRLRTVLALPNTCPIHSIQNTQVILLGKNQMDHNSYLKNHELSIIDPHGNLIMYYENRYNPIDLHDDLSQLLRVSSIG